MARVLTVARIELQKLLAQRAFLVASMVLLLAWKVIALIEIRASGLADSLDDFRINGFYLVAHSAKTGLTFWVVLLFVLVCQWLAGEAERGQLRMLLTRPLPRRTFYLGKLLAIAATVGCALVLDSLLGVAIGGVALGFGDVADTALQGDMYSAAAIAGDLVQAYLLTGLALFATAAVALCLSALFRQSTAVTTVGLLFLAVCGTVGFVFGEPLDRWLVTTWDVRSFAVLEQLTAGTSIYRDGGETVWAVLVPAGTVALSALVGAGVFRRRDVAG